MNIMCAADRAQRNEIIRRAHLEHGYSLSDIGRAVGLLYSMDRRLVNLQADENAQNKI